MEAIFQRTSLEDKARVWRQIADLPVTQSTCESFLGRLLAVGGLMESGKVTTAVYMYNFTANSWEIISYMTTGRRLCFTAVIPDNQLMIVGGFIGKGAIWVSNSVELAIARM
jgi:N-acetylneuraminic acid mutarotase